jgi:hypothetical protein
MPDFSPLIREAYSEILGREADPSGLASFNRLMNDGMSEAAMREALLRSPEFAATHPDPDLTVRLGLNVHIPSDAILEDVAVNLGMRWIRVDFDWYRLEPQQGVLRFEEWDRLVSTATGYGLSILGTLAYTPPWASANPGNPRISDPPASVSFWTDIVRRVVTRYREHVRYWQFWNEPNLGQFWGGSRTQLRTQIVEPGARVAKEVDPGALVVCPGLADVRDWRDWFREILVAQDLVDVINHHNYEASGREVILELERDSGGQPSLRTLMRQLGVDDKPFWLTETGRRSDESNENQRQFYESVVSTLREETWVDRLFFFHYWDGPGQGNGGQGIVNENFTPKPAYRFLQSVLGTAAVRETAPASA